MPVTTIGQVLVNEALPPEHRDYERSLIGDTLDNLLGEIGHKDPDLYRTVSHRLVQLGREAAYQEGTTLDINDLVPPKIRKEVFASVRQGEQAIRRQKLPREQQRAELGKLYGAAHKLLVERTFEEAKAGNNPLALQVLARARGNQQQLASILASPGPFMDAAGTLIPVFPTRSYAEGLRPHEYYAATFGARQGVISTKQSTRQAGDLGKQLLVAAEGLMITEDDCGTSDGIPVAVDDGDSVGAVLARDAGGFKGESIVDPKMLRTMGDKGVTRIVVRSPITCKADKGICRRCAGLDETGKLPALGTAIGLLSASPLGERTAQGALNYKHQGGTGKLNGSEEQTYAGFEYINQLAQVPETFKHAATLASVAGRVDAIEEAPQGGYYITVGKERHYVLPEHLVRAKVGDVVEAGDQLSSGLVNPAEVVQYKGIGEGRRYFAERLTQAFRDSKLTVNRRNVEVVARAAIDHVDTNDEVGDYLPGDVASYSRVERGYRPRPGSLTGAPAAMLGKYLEQPALHYTIGTPITKTAIKELEEFGVNQVMAHEVEPPFTPRMIRLRAVPHHGDDWMAKMHGSYLMTNLLADVHRGAESDIHGQNPVPAIAYGVELGQSKPDEVTY